MSGLRGHQPDLIASGVVEGYTSGELERARWRWHSPGFSDDAPEVRLTGIRIFMAPGNGLGASALEKTAYGITVTRLTTAAPTAPAVENIIVAADGMSFDVFWADSADDEDPARVTLVSFYVECRRMPAV